MAYLCLVCNTIHGWEDDPRVMKVVKHHRGAWEDIWYCPGCNRQNRTGDGTMMGQMDKMYQEIDLSTLGERITEMTMNGHFYETYSGLSRRRFR